MTCDIDIKKLNAIISNKISNYKCQDNRYGRPLDNYITIDYVRKLLEIQNYKCYICSDTVLIDKWEKYCLYQFTIDRINNNLGHIKSNCLISCYFCNCYGPIDLELNDDEEIINRDTYHKVCRNLCHTNKKDIQRTRLTVPEDEIKQILSKLSMDN
jgi:hypothetical protein